MNSDSDQLQPSREHENYDGSEQEEEKISRKKSSSWKKERKSRSRSKDRQQEVRRERRSSRRSRSTSRGRREHHERSGWKMADRKASIRVGKKIPKVLLILRQKGDGNKFEIVRKRTDDPFRKNLPQPNRCLGIFGLSTSTTEKELMAIFSKYGHVDSCTVVMNGQTRRSRGFCFIYFSTVDEATAAKEACNGMEINGCPVRVDFSITQRAHTPTPGVYMGRYRRDGPIRRRRVHEDRPSYRRSPSPCRNNKSRSRQYYRDSRSRSRSPHYRHHRR